MPDWTKQPRYDKPKMIKKPKATVGDMLKRTSKGDRDRSKNIAVSRVGATRVPTQLGGWIGFKVRTRNKSNGHSHMTHIFMEELGSKDKDGAKVIIMCDCAHYTYTYEVANARKLGASFVYRSNGEDPGIRNPGMRPGLCMHAYLALRYFARRQNR